MDGAEEHFRVTTVYWCDDLGTGDYRTTWLTYMLQQELVEEATRWRLHTSEWQGCIRTGTYLRFSVVYNSQSLFLNRFRSVVRAYRTEF